MVWLKFLLAAIIILFAGTKLARYGDTIAEKTGLGRLWIGLVLLAAVTSSPESVTAVSSAALIKLPDLALGTLLGSCLYNLTILALLDVLYRGAPILSKVSRGHMASAGMGALLMALAGGSILAGERFSELSLGWVGIPSIVIIISYLVYARQTFYFERKRNSVPSPTESLMHSQIPTGTAYLRFSMAAVAVIAAGIWLSFIGDEIARTTGWGISFVGSLFLAISTSMPELVVTVAAVRLGAADMAVANLLGANMLDVVAILWADLFYTQGPLLAVVSKTHLITAGVTIIANLLVIAGLGFRQKRKTFIVTSWYGPLLIGLYLFAAYALFVSDISPG